MGSGHLAGSKMADLCALFSTDHEILTAISNSSLFAGLKETSYEAHVVAQVFWGRRAEAKLFRKHPVLAKRGWDVQGIRASMSPEGKCYLIFVLLSAGGGLMARLVVQPHLIILCLSSWASVSLWHLSGPDASTFLPSLPQSPGLCFLLWVANMAACCLSHGLLACSDLRSWWSPSTPLPEWSKQRWFLTTLQHCCQAVK